MFHVSSLSSDWILPPGFKLETGRLEVKSSQIVHKPLIGWTVLISKLLRSQCTLIKRLRLIRLTATHILVGAWRSDGVPQGGLVGLRHTASVGHDVERS